MNTPSTNRPKIFVVFNDRKFMGKLTKFFTGCYAYHTGFIVTESRTIYDMDMLFRQVLWADEKYSEDEIMIFDLPDDVTITEQDLIEEVLRGVDRLCNAKGFLQHIYGYLDYVMFALRGVYHLFGQSTHNMTGEICSEKIVNMLVKHGWKSNPFTKEVPSPCDIFKFFKTQ